MSRIIKVILTEEEAEENIKQLGNSDVCYGLYKKIVQAFKEPYTNFDKIKDELSIEKLKNHCNNSIFQDISSISEERIIQCFKKYNSNFCKNKENCEECSREWLESSVNE